MEDIFLEMTMTKTDKRPVMRMTYRGVEHYTCPKCFSRFQLKSIFKKPRFCSNCGQEFRWTRVEYR